MQSGWMNNFDSHCISESRIIFPDLLLKSKYVFWTLLSKSSGIYGCVRISRNYHRVPGSQEQESSRRFGLPRRKLVFCLAHQ